MLGSSLPIPTNRECPRWTCFLAKRSKGWAFLAVLLVSAGCESVETVDIKQPLPPNLTMQELLVTTKSSWELCLADFYRDDWERVKDHVVRLTELARRWKAERVPGPAAKEFQANTAGFESAVQSFAQAVEKKNVDAATEALRQVGKRITTFESMRTGIGSESGSAPEK